MQTLERPTTDLSAAFRGAISHFATGVTVITTSTEAGPAGMTASAVASLSLDPLQLLICVRTDLSTHAAISTSGRFVVNVLGSGAEDLACRFATPGVDKFADVALRAGYDLPVIDDAIAHFVCNVSAALPGGDHTIFIGDIADCGHIAEAEPLVYFSRRFSEICSPTAHEHRLPQASRN